jgi:hypothetical protein
MKKSKFIVGISKVYFPRELWPKNKFEEYFEVYEIKAYGNAEAAHLIWAAHGKRWLLLMRPRTSKLPRIISLHTSYPGGHWLGRLSPIEVYVERI